MSHEGDFGHGLALTDRPCLYDGLDRPWDQAANGLFALRAAISAGDEGRRAGGAGRVPPGGHGRRPRGVRSTGATGGAPRRSTPLNDDAHVEVFALDALAPVAAAAGDQKAAHALCEEADRRMERAAHFIAERDRTDAQAVRQRHPADVAPELS